MIVRTRKSLSISLALLVFLLAVPFAKGLSAAEATPSDQENFLIRAVFADGELWVLSDAGQIFRIKEGRNEPLA
ncbi:MAG TPA: hypothetical protein VGQ41_16630 [Pyrinomonadaceae bacterium]|jgi:hypothetical protein|nr:hypothetical protein [Pyrinomonadaceae bacterium]